jgi:hypothetical protein
MSAAWRPPTVTPSSRYRDSACAGSRIRPAKSSGRVAQTLYISDRESVLGLALGAVARVPFHLRLTPEPGSHVRVGDQLHHDTIAII